LTHLDASLTSLLLYLYPMLVFLGAVALATTIYGEALGAGQLAGGVLVLGAVVILQLRTGTVEGDVAPAHAAARPPARTLAYDAA
jgi:drug/metabolite transporter (DMT)-like permease